jgi:hypothetical protein
VLLESKIARKVAHPYYDGPIVKIIITDGGDHTVFEWQRGKGITFPEEQ